MGLGVRISSITACFRFLLAAASSFSSKTSRSARSAFFKIALQTSSFLLIVIDDCIPALVWPNTGRPKMSTSDLLQREAEYLQQPAQFKSYLTAGCVSILMMVPCGVAWDAVPGKLQHKSAFKPPQDIP